MIGAAAGLERYRADHAADRHFDDAGPWDTEAVWTRFDSVLATSGGFFVEANGLIFDARRGS